MYFLSDAVWLLRHQVAVVAFVERDDVMKFLTAVKKPKEQRHMPTCTPSTGLLGRSTTAALAEFYPD